MVEIHDAHGQGHQPGHEQQRRPREPVLGPSGVAHLELLQLRHKNNNGQAVNKAVHHRLRHQPNELAQPQQPDGNLNEPHQGDGGKQVLNPVLGHQGHDNHRHRAGRPRNHARAATEHARDKADDKRGPDAHQGADVGQQGKRNHLRDQGQGRGQAREDFVLDVEGILPEIGNDRGHKCAEKWAKEKSRPLPAGSSSRGILRQSSGWGELKNGSVESGHAWSKGTKKGPAPHFSASHGPMRGAGWPTASLADFYCFSPLAGGCGTSRST